MNIRIAATDDEIAACFPVMQALRPHLDSGLQRRDAHRFYAREGMAASGYHFAVKLPTC